MEQTTKQPVKYGAQIEVFEWADVRGNKLLYLKITKGKNELVINIGQKSYDALTKLDETMTKIQFDQPQGEKAVIIDTPLGKKQL